MTECELKQIFKDKLGEYGEFGRIPPARRHSNRPDVLLFVMLDKLIPSDSDIVTAAGHDEIYINIEASQLAEKATAADVIDMIRCGLCWDSEADSFVMFV